MTNSHTSLTRLINEAVRHQNHAAIELANSLQHQVLEMNGALESLRKRVLATSQLQVQIQQLLNAYSGEDEHRFRRNVNT